MYVEYVATGVAEPMRCCMGSSLRSLERALSGRTVPLHACSQEVRCLWVLWEDKLGVE